MGLTGIKDILEALSYLATIIGIPVAIGIFLYEKRKDRASSELDTYMRSNEKYVQYLTLCLQYPQLGGFDNLLEEKEVQESGLSVEQLTLFTVLVSTLETGYLLYRNHSSSIRESQWQGWFTYMVYWATRDDFRRAWKALASQFDKDFESLMDELITGSRPQFGAQRIRLDRATRSGATI